MIELTKICAYCKRPFGQGNKQKDNFRRQKHCGRPCYEASRTDPVAVVAKFWAKVDKSAGCWIYTGPKNEWGYGLFNNIVNKNTRAHRYSYELAKGPIPPGLVVMHSCDNPPCVNPAHLSLGTDADNMADAVAKGRATRITRAKLTEAQALEILKSKPATVRGSQRVAEEFSATYGITPGAVMNIWRGDTWAHLPREPQGERDK